MTPKTNVALNGPQTLLPDFAKRCPSAITAPIDVESMLREASDAIEKCRNARAPLGITDESYLLRLELQLLGTANQMKQRKAENAEYWALADALEENRRASEELDAELDDDSFESRRRHESDDLIQYAADQHDGAGS